MNLFRRIALLLVLIPAGLYGGFVILFSLYGLSQGFNVISGVMHLHELDPDPATTQPQVEDVTWQRVSWVGDIENRALNESSGLAASSLHEGVLWSINDSGNDPVIYAVGIDGTDLGEWQIDTTANVDWESMDAFSLNGTSYLAIGDTGDNFRWRPNVSVLIVEEPTQLTRQNAPLPVVWQVTYSYPDGYRDSEAMAIDADTETIYVLSKRHYPPELFRVPLRGRAETAEKLTEFIDFPRPTEIEIEEDMDRTYRYAPGGMDLAGGRLLITSYKHAYLYDLSDLEAPPKRVQLPSIGQREALTFAQGSDEIAYISRERGGGKGPADLFMIELAPASAQTLPAETTGVQ